MANDLVQQDQESCCKFHPFSYPESQTCLKQTRTNFHLAIGKTLDKEQRDTPIQEYPVFLAIPPQSLEGNIRKLDFESV